MNSNDPPATAPPVETPASQPHGTTQDQVNEMESEGQATKPGQLDKKGQALRPPHLPPDGDLESA
jgi:hypothetical protein